MNWLMSIIGTPLGYILWVCFKIIPNYALALVLFTVITKLLMFPLAVKQQKNTVKQARLQPKLQALQKQYANNREKYQEEMQKLYQEEHMSMFGGCGTMLIQLPILYGLIDVVYKPMTHLLHLPTDVINKCVEIAKGLGYNVGKGQEWYVQLRSIQAFNKSPEAFSSLGTEITDKLATVDLNLFGIIDLGETPQFAWNLLVLIPIISAVTALASSIISMKLQEKNNPNMQMGNTGKGMMLVMPLVSGFFATMVPAGVGFYWILSNILTGVQTIILYKIYNPREMIAKAEAEEAARKEEQRQARIAAREEAMANRDNNKSAGKKGTKSLSEEALTQKEINRRRLAEARRRDAEKYGEDFVEPTDDDVN